MLEGSIDDPAYGLSPRLRGNHLDDWCGFPVVGSIPAPAGEPWSQAARWTSRRVYPRACGGTKRVECHAYPPLGLSPRLRGNRQRLSALWDKGGSIPAPAGEPGRARSNSSVGSVYPRACGGTSYVNVGHNPSSGLSPRLRGNQYRCVLSRVCRRSIPAPAGEPSVSRARRSCARVYPRACGGTLIMRMMSPLKSGLSPRLRGNHGEVAQVLVWQRSIPAPAGEPRPRETYGRLFKVYPRACGGTAHLPHDLVVHVRSIPAPAGEPPSCTRQTPPTSVYPRACGGTVNLARPRAELPGLSPRLRGNRTASTGGAAPRRSIPAPAGEPKLAISRSICAAVYPRACGGTAWQTN